LFQQPLPRGLNGDRHPPPNGSDLQDDRAVSSSDGSKTSSQPGEVHNGRLRKKTPAPIQSNGNLSVNYTPSMGNLSVHNDREVPGQRTGDLPSLSPIKPLSPLNF
jgi:hypothetical protein